MVDRWARDCQNFDCQDVNVPHSCWDGNNVLIVLTQIKVRNFLCWPHTVDGDLFVAGNNDSGQLGIKGYAAVPPESVRVAAFDSLAVRHVSMGISHTLAILRNGMLATWGSNEYGQLGEFYLQGRVAILHE